jgi:hypothetical protein
VTGPIEQPHVRPWATALRLPTAQGVVWFKAAAPPWDHEAAVLRVVGPLAPSLLPTVLASTEDGWLLLADAGERVREHPVDWSRVAAPYAELQRASAGHVDALLAAGAFDNRPAAVVAQAESLLPVLPAELADRLAEHLPGVAEQMVRLADSQLPVTVDHGDLHDGNVFSREGRITIIDWGDSAVAHPFFTLSVADDDEIAPTLRAWKGDHEEELAIVREHRFLIRALNWRHLAAYGAPWSEHLHDRVQRFLGVDA